MSSATAVPIRPVKSSYMVWLWLGIVAAVLLAYALARIGTYDENAGFLSSNSAKSGVVTTASGLQYEVIEKGDGPTPSAEDVALIDYVGQDIKGEEFDRSQQPTPFPVAPGATVPGFSEALMLMPRGSKYRIWMKPELGYGAPPPEGVDISNRPPNPLAKKILVFDVTMLDFMSRAEFMQQMQARQAMGGGPGGPPPGAGPPPGQ